MCARNTLKQHFLSFFVDIFLVKHIITQPQQQSHWVIIYGTTISFSVLDLLFTFHSWSGNISAMENWIFSSLVILFHFITLTLISLMSSNSFDFWLFQTTFLRSKILRPIPSMFKLWHSLFLNQEQNSLAALYGPSWRVFYS